MCVICPNTLPQCDMRVIAILYTGFIDNKIFIIITVVYSKNCPLAPSAPTHYVQHSNTV